MSEEMVKELQTLVTDLRTTVESKNAESSEAKEKVEKLENRIIVIEESNQKLVAERAEAKKVEEGLKEDHKNLERQLYTRASGMSKDEKSVEMKAFEKFVTKGAKNLDAEEMKYLRTDNNPAGGYLAPAEYLNEILKDITEVSPIRSVSRIRTTSSPKMEIPTRTGLVVSYYEGEGATTPASQSTYGKENLKLNRLSAVTEITLESLNMSAFNMEAEITSDIVESFAQTEGRAFVLGDGVEKPEGFMVNPNVPEINSGAATELTADALIKILGELKTGYNPMWAYNRRTFATILQLQDGAGQYIWTVGNFQAGVPNMLLGHEYLLAIDMDDVAADAYPIIFGDFARGYMIGDHSAFAVIRDDNTLAADGKVRFIMHRWNGGQVVKAEAFVKMKVAA